MEECPICGSLEHPEIAHMELEIEPGVWGREVIAQFDEPPEPMSLEDEMQNYPERFWVDPETGEWERW